MSRFLKHFAVSVMGCLLFAGGASAADTARYILPPGNFGGIPTTNDSLDQLPLYDGLTPLRGNVTAADINSHYIPEDFNPIGAIRPEPTGRAGLTLLYDSFGVPHIYGKTRDDVSFGAGWVTQRDRGLLIQLARGAARVAVADVPGIDAFGLVTSVKSFTPSKQAEALVTREKNLIVKTYGAKGRAIIHDAQVYVDGANAYRRAHNVAGSLTVNDVIATTAFIGSIFGAGGGGEAANSNLLARLQRKLGKKKGHAAWSDLLLANDPEAPTTIKKTFKYGPLTGGKVKGSVTVDAGSIKAFDPVGKSSAKGIATKATNAPPRRRASNFQVVAPSRSATGNTLAVMGPQLGYYYPEIVQQMDLHGPGLNAQGATVPGLSMYLLLGRTKNYAWSLTSAGHDVRDVYAEKLCKPGGGKATRKSTHYLYKGKCRKMKTFNTGTLGKKALKFKTTVHGGVIGTAKVKGKPYALARKRSTYLRDGLNLAALKDMTEGKGDTPAHFYKAANQFGFTFNWAYANRTQTANFSSGRMPVRPKHLDRRLPTLGTGKYEWKGYLKQNQHPHDTSGPKGLLLNWNNRSAPGFMHGDDEPYGSVQRVEMFNKWPAKVTLPNAVSVMNRAATQDLRSPVWPVVSKVLSTGKAPNARSAQVKALLDNWVARDAPRLDADNSGTYDEASPTIMDNIWTPIVKGVLRPRVGGVLSTLDDVRGLGSLSGESYVDKDLRTLLKRKVRGKFNLRYCGKGKLSTCRKALWSAISTSTAKLATKQGPDPTKWRSTASRISFVPGLIPKSTMRFTNRPTFQQVLEFGH